MKPFDTHLKRRIENAYKPLLCLLFITVFWTIQSLVILLFSLLNLIITGDLLNVADVVSRIYKPGTQFALWISNSQIIKHDIVGAIIILFVAVGLYSVIPGIILFSFYESKSRKKNQRIKQGYCENCDYNLKGNITGKCPECGTGFDPKTLPMYDDNSNLTTEYRD